MKTNITIHNPKGINLSDIQKEVVQTAECITATFSYPNGFILKAIQKADGIEYQTSSPLIQISENEFQIPD